MAWVAMTCAPASGGDEGGDEPTDRVRFQVERTRDVANDWLRAVVGITDEGPDAAALADRVNRTMAWALETARAAQGVKVKSGGYRTHPIYDRQKLRRWRASQDLILEGGDADAITALVGRLQSRLQLRSFQFQVSPERRRQVEDELIAEALAAFGARAEIVRKSLGASGYGIGEISIDTGGTLPPSRPMHLEMRAAAAEVAPPAVEVGSSQLVVHVRGSIALE
jgi:predicted secreted protein